MQIGKERYNVHHLSLIFLFLSLLGAVVAVIILAGVPPVSRDALTHHLFIPKLYLQHGGIYEIPHISFSYYPMNLDLLYLIPLYFGNDIFPKFIHFAFALITAAMIFQYLKRRINMTYALLGAFFFLTIPVIVRLSTTVYVDLGLICFLFASILCLFRWIETGFHPKYLLISALFCGLALGTKYNALIGLFLLGLFVVIVYARYNAKRKFSGLKSIGWSAVFVTAALIMFSPWMIRNVAWTGNPLYPLYKGVFNSDTTSEEETRPENLLRNRSRMSHIQVRHQIYGESLLEIVLVPLRVFFQGKDDSPQYFDGKMNPFLLFLPVFAFFGIRSAHRQEKTEKLIMLFFSALFLLYACAQTSIRIRYFSPILPPLVVLSIFGLYNIQNTSLMRGFRFSLSFKKAVVLAITFLMLGLNINYMAARFKKDQPLTYITGKVSREEYIQAYRPEYASFQYANHNLDENAKILGLYVGNRGYYSDVFIDFSIEILQDYAAKAGSAETVAEKIRQKGFTHLLINFSLFNYWVNKYGLHERRMLKDFFDEHTVEEFAKDGYGLLRVAPGK